MLFDYIASFRGEQIRLRSSSSWNAYCDAVDFFHPYPKEKHLVRVVRAEDALTERGL